ncbi:MAG: FAD-dependent oxidoreductase [Candidatus Methanoperedens sp.]|nr:FAD-dependent oxidoreductase [Candidatus Methanoperedens sp.]
MKKQNLLNIFIIWGFGTACVPDFIADSLCELGIEKLLNFVRDHFQVRRGSLDVIISEPLDQVEAQLMDQFPKERRGITSIIKILDEVIKALDVLAPYDLIKQTPGCIADFKACEVLERWGDVPARDILDRHLEDKSLKDLLGSQGTSETEMLVVLLAQMWRFMSKVGIWYVKGGIENVSLLLAEQVRSMGGQIQLGERVTCIHLKNGVAAGVELAGGTIIKAPLVISDADYRETICNLLPPAFSNKESELATKMALTSSAFTLFLGIKRDMIDLSAFKGDHLFIKLKEGKPVPWELKKQRKEDFLQDDIWLSWWSRHDPTLAPPGHEAMIIKIADAIVAASEIILPGLSRGVVIREVATPLTYKYWGHRSKGSVAGWSWRSKEQAGPWSQSFTVTKVPGLYVVGLQSFSRLFYGGMGTSMFSGKYAADIII